MRLVFAGTPEVAVPSLRALLDSEHDVVAVLTRPDARAGRGRGSLPSPIKQVALESGVEVLTPRSAGDPAFVERLKELQPDACPIVAYGGLIRAAALAVPRLGWINLHFSLLPAWRGAAPVQHAVMAGDEITGASTFVLEQGLDTGPVIGTMTEAIRPQDTAGDVLDRLATAGAPLLLRSLEALADGRAAPRAQSAHGVSLAPKIDVDDARVRWSLPAVALERRIRGCTPAPGAWSLWRGDRIKLAPVQLSAEGADLAPGAIRAGKRDVLVGTLTQAVRLSTVQPPGKKPMAAADWARGVRIGEDRFDGESDQHDDSAETRMT